MPRNPILLCAPTDDLRKHIEGVLSAAEYPTTSVRSAPDAVAALRDAPFDLVIAEGLAVSGAIPGIRSAAGVPKFASIWKMPRPFSTS